MGDTSLLHQSATVQEIQKWVFRNHGLQVETDWIAHCQELCGLTEPAAAERREWEICPPEIQPALKQAFRHFGMLPPEA